jgi:hypothetical protein
MNNIALLLLLSSCCMIPIHASPNYYAVLMTLEDTFDTTTETNNQVNDDNQTSKSLSLDAFVAECQRDLIIIDQTIEALTNSKVLTPVNSKQCKTKSVTHIYPRHVTLAIKIDETLNHLLRN